MQISRRRFLEGSAALALIATLPRWVRDELPAFDEPVASLERSRPEMVTRWGAVNTTRFVARCRLLRGTVALSVFQVPPGRSGVVSFSPGDWPVVSDDLAVEVPTGCVGSITTTRSTQLFVALPAAA